MSDQEALPKVNEREAAGPRKGIDYFFPHSTPASAKQKETNKQNQILLTECFACQDLAYPGASVVV